MTTTDLLTHLTGLFNNALELRSIHSILITRAFPTALELLNNFLNELYSLLRALKQSNTSSLQKLTFLHLQTLAHQISDSNRSLEYVLLLASSSSPGADHLTITSLARETDKKLMANIASTRYLINEIDTELHEIRTMTESPASPVSPTASVSGRDLQRGLVAPRPMRRRIDSVARYPRESVNPGVMLPCERRPRSDAEIGNGIIFPIAVNQYYTPLDLGYVYDYGYGHEYSHERRDIVRRDRPLTPDSGTTISLSPDHETETEREQEAHLAKHYPAIARPELEAFRVTIGKPLSKVKEFARRKTGHGQNRDRDEADGKPRRKSMGSMSSGEKYAYVAIGAAVLRAVVKAR